MLNVIDDNGGSWKKLGVSLEKLDSYKRMRIGTADPEMGKLYFAIIDMLRENPDLFPTMKAGG